MVTLVVYITKSNDALLNEYVARAKEHRAGMFGQASITAKGIVNFNQIGAKDSNELAGYRLTINDTKREQIRQGVDLEIALDAISDMPQTDPFGFPSQSSWDWQWLGPNPTISAALAAFRTQDGDFVFQRFLTDVTSEQLEMPPTQ